MRSAICISAQLLELLDAKGLQSIGQSDADAGVLLMVACAFDLEALSVQKKAAFCVPAQRSNSKRRVVSIEHLRSALDRRSKQIQIWGVRRPQPRTFQN